MEPSKMKYGGNALFKLQPLSKLRIYMANKTGLDKIEYSLQELLEMLNRHGNSGGSWDLSSQKMFELAENMCFI